MIAQRTLYSADPLAWEIRPGLLVGDLETVEQCEEAVHFLDLRTDAMMGQIGRVEAGEDERPPGWRSKVQAALRWTARIRKAVNVRLTTMRADTPTRHDNRRKAMLAVIYDEVGEEEFARFAAITEAKHPHLFKGGEHAA